MVIRAATIDDAAALAAIYAPAVQGGTATFEDDVPDATEMAARLIKVRDADWPWLVAEDAGAVAGFAYAGQFRDRPAYRQTCECSIYVEPRAHRRGHGRGLLEALADAATVAGFRRMIAVIGDSGNLASIGLHRACGFAVAGTLRDVGFKFGRWLDVVYMQRGLGH